MRLVEIHTSEKTKGQWYRTGTWLEEDDVDWEVPGQIVSPFRESGNLAHVITLDSHTVLEVYLSDKARYRFGVLSDKGRLIWKESHDYVCSNFPAVCKVDEETVLEVHQSHVFKTLYYHVKSVDGIKWELHNGGSDIKFENAGVNPFLLQLEGKQVVVFFEFQDRIHYRFGIVEDREVCWGVRRDGFAGNHPKNVYMGNQKVLCFYCKGNDIFSRVGEIKEDKIVWSECTRMADGSHISVTRIPDTQKLVEVHTEKNDFIYYNTGLFSENKIIWSKNQINNTCLWMDKIDGNKLLSEINIPGSHDSGTAYLEDGDHKNYTCQVMTIEEQLLAGIRYFDIRCSVLKDDKIPVIKHAKVQCLTGPEKTNLTLEDVFQYGEKFLKDNPSETLLYELKCEDIDVGGNSLRTIRSFLDKRIGPESEYVWQGKDFSQIPRLKDVRGKIVLLCRWKNPKSAFDLSRWPNNTTWSRSGPNFYIQDHYGTGYENKKVIVKKAVEKTQGIPVNAMVLNYLSCTNPYPLTEAKQMNPWLVSFLKDEKIKRLGTVVLDFATPGLCQTVIATNFV